MFKKRRVAMGQFGQTNDLQEAIDQVASNDSGNNSVDSDVQDEKVSNIQDQLGVPPMPEPFPAGDSSNSFSDIMPPSPEDVTAPDAPSLDGGIPDAPAAPDAAPHTSAPIDIVNPAPIKPIEEPAPEAPKPEDTPAAPETPEAPASDVPSAEAILSEGLASEDENLKAVRENILKDLMPLMDKVQGTPEEKFTIYKDAIDTLHDKNLVSDAYSIASQIDDETKKASSLLELMQAIDKK